MGRLILGALGVVLVLLIGGAVYLWSQLRSLGVEEVANDVYMLTGVGGNVGVLRTDAGAVVVDSMTFQLQGERIRERAEELGGGPIQLVINTHYHGDHTHGNPAFEAGTDVVATARTLAHLRALDAEYWVGEAAALLPNRTFDARDRLEIAGNAIEVHHLGRGHTDGDLVVLFVEQRVLHAGDLVFNMLYPNIDLEAGGSIEAWSGTLDRVLELEFDRVIPGHGAVTDRQGIERFRRFLEQLWAVGQRAQREGWTLEQTQQSGALTADAGFEPIAIPFLLRLDRPFVLRRAFEEATGAVQTYDAPAVAR